MNKRKMLFCALALALGVQTRAQTVTADDVRVKPGETAEVTVSLSGGKANAYTSMTLNVLFPNSTSFTMVDSYDILSQNWKDAWLDDGKTEPGTLGVVGDINANSKTAIIPFASSEAIANSAKEQIVKIRFKVAENVPDGEYAVTLKATEFGYNTSDKDVAEDVTFKVKVSENDVLKGDVDGDGEIKAIDASLVLQIVAKIIAPDAPGIVFEAADVDGDGEIKAIDASLILQYVANIISNF